MSTSERRRELRSGLIVMLIAVSIYVAACMIAAYAWGG